MLKKAVLLFFLILLCSFVSGTDYSELGTSTHYYALDRAETDSVTVTTDFVETMLGSPIGTPFFGDLDNNGVMDIAVFDVPDVRTYIFNITTESIVGVDSLTLNSSGTYFNGVWFDVDGDSRDEFITVDSGTPSGMDLYIVDYNDGVLSLQNKINLRNLTATSNQDYAYVGCYDTDKCVVVYEEDHSGYKHHSVLSFGSSKGYNYADINLVGSLVTDGGNVCPSTTPTVAWDGSYGYFGGIHLEEGDDEVYIGRFFLNGSGYVSRHSEIIYDIGAVVTCSADDCRCDGTSTPAIDEPVGKYVSQPLVKDLVSGNNLEVVIASHTNGLLIDPTLIYVFKGRGCVADGTAYEQCKYKDIGDSVTSFLDGEQGISNIWVGDYFDYTGNQSSTYPCLDNSGRCDICVAGFDDDNTLGVLCGNPNVNLLIGNEHEVFESSSFPDNWSLGFTNAVPSFQATHSVSAEDTIYDGFYNPDEVLTSFGVYGLVNEVIFPVWQNPYSDFALSGGVANSDHHRITFAGLSTDSFVYYYDNLVNSLPALGNVTFNPCLSESSPIKQNTSFTVTIVPVDFDNDFVQVRVINYADKNYSQDTGWSENLTSRQQKQYSSGSGLIVMNQTTTNTFLRVMIRDVESPDQPRSFDYHFSVASFGLEFGDISCSFEDPLFPEDELPDDEDIIQTGLGRGTNLNNNTVVNIIDSLTADSGLNRGVVWLFIMLVYTFAILFYGMKAGWSGASTTGAGFLVAFVWTFIGTSLGILDGIYLILMIFITGFFVVMWWRNQISSDR